MCRHRGCSNREIVGFPAADASVDQDGVVWRLHDVGLDRQDQFARVRTDGVVDQPVHIRFKRLWCSVWEHGIGACERPFDFEYAVDGDVTKGLWAHGCCLT